MKEHGLGTRSDEQIAVNRIRHDQRMVGCFVALFFGGMSFWGLNSLCSHFIKDKKKNSSR